MFVPPFPPLQARNNLGPTERGKVSQFMCHDTSTADRFYALNLTPRDAAQHRAIFDQLVCGD